MTQINISQFKQRFLEDGLSSPAKYFVSINRKTDKTKGKVMLQPEAINLPGRTFKTFEDEIYGAPRQVPLREQYEPVVMTFPVSETWKERGFFEKWMKDILNPETKTVRYPGPWADGSATMDIIPLTRNETSASLFRLHEVYPISIIPINMGFGMMNDYTRLQVSFAYRDYSYKDYTNLGNDWLAEGGIDHPFLKWIEDSWPPMWQKPPGTENMLDEYKAELQDEIRREAIRDKLIEILNPWDAGRALRNWIDQF